MARPCQSVPECAIPEKPFWTGNYREFRPLIMRAGLSAACGSKSPNIPIGENPSAHGIAC